MSDEPRLLDITNLHAHYGRSHVLQGVNLTLGAGQVVALLGRNGVGKTTLVNTVMGIVQASDGAVRLDGEDLVGRRPHQVAKRGVALVPQGRHIFGGLTVEENIRLAVRGGRSGPWTIDRVCEFLPVLADRLEQRGQNLSGGQQQMLAIGRALASNPRLLLLDEPSDGLAPIIIDEVVEIVRKLVDEGVQVLLVEQNLSMAMRLADVVYVMDRGKIVHQAPMSEFRRSRSKAQALLGVA